MRQPSRRAFLGLAASLSLSSGGCLGRGEGDGASTDAAATTTPDTATTTPSSSGTSATDAATPRALGTERTVGGRSVTVSNVGVRDALLYLDTPDSMTVANRDGKRYVLVSIEGSESGPPPEAFSLRVDGDDADVADVRGGLDDYGPRYDPGYTGETGYLPFVVPVDLDADEGHVSLEYEGETAAWRLDDTHLAALHRSKPRFELRTVELPDRIRPDARLRARVAAENVSDVAGVFKGVLNVANLGAAYVPYAFELDAEPGETVTWEKTFDERPPDGADAVGFFLYTVAGDREGRAPVAVGTAVGTATATESERE
jgi:hypothetical protein